MRGDRLLDVSERWFRLLQRLYPADFRDEMGDANIAAFYARQGADGTAEHLFVRALAALEHIEARDPRRVAVLQGLASLYATQGRRADAARIESALAAARATLSPRFTVPTAEEP